MFTKEERLILNIMHLSYLVDVETPYCTFVYWSGHIQQLRVNVRESRDEWQHKLFESEISAAYRKNRDEYSPQIAYLKSCVDILINILKEHEIPYEELDYEEEYVRHYTM